MAPWPSCGLVEWAESPTSARRGPIGGSGGEVEIEGRLHLFGALDRSKKCGGFGPDGSDVRLPGGDAARLPRVEPAERQAPEEGGVRTGLSRRRAHRHDADHVPGRDIALREHGGVEARVFERHGRPQRAIGEGAGLCPGNRAAKGGLGARGVDGKIEWTVPASGLFDENRPVIGGGVDCRDRGCRDDLDPVPLYGFKERIEEACPVNADAVEVAAEIGIGDVEDLAARGEGGAVEPVDARAGRGDPGEQTQAAENAKTGRLEEEAGADRPRHSSKRSKMRTRCPPRARKRAVAMPAGPQPTTAISREATIAGQGSS